MDVKKCVGKGRVLLESWQSLHDGSCGGDCTPLSPSKDPKGQMPSIWWTVLFWLFGYPQRLWWSSLPSMLGKPHLWERTVPLAHGSTRSIALKGKSTLSCLMSGFDSRALCDLQWVIRAWFLSRFPPVTSLHSRVSPQRILLLVWCALGIHQHGRNPTHIQWSVMLWHCAKSLVKNLDKLGVDGCMCQWYGVMSVPLCWCKTPHPSPSMVWWWVHTANHKHKPLVYLYIHTHAHTIPDKRQLVVFDPPWHLFIHLT